MAGMVQDLLKKLSGDVSVDSLYESSGISKVMEADVEKMSEKQLTESITFLKRQLGLISGYGERAEVKKDLEERISLLESAVEEHHKKTAASQKKWLKSKGVDLPDDASDADIKKAYLKKEKELGMAEGKVPDPKASTTDKIADLKEAAPEEEAPGENEPPVEEPAPEPEPEKTPADGPMNPPPQAGPGAGAEGPTQEPYGTAEDLVGNLQAAKDHFEKGNLKVAAELLKVVKDSLKGFEEQIKAAKEAESAKKQQEQAADEIPESKVQEQDLKILASGISDEQVAQKMARDLKGVARKDMNDEKKYMIVAKESFSPAEVDAMLKEMNEELEQVKAQKLEENKEEKFELKTLKENLEELAALFAKMMNQKEEVIKETIQTLDEKKKEVLEATGNLAILKKLEVSEKQSALLSKLLKEKKEVKPEEQTDES